MSDNAANPNEYDVLDAQLNRHRTNMDKETAFVTILAGAMFADHRAHTAERTELDALLNRVRILQSLTPAERMAKRDDVLPGVRDDKMRGDRVRIACAAIVQAEKGGVTPGDQGLPNLAVSVFAHACDIIYDDLDVTELEKAFIRDIAKHLSIPGAEAAKIVEIISKKNEY
ncbi:MAG: hypothetical protein AB7Q23_15415 [Hyphomonadaceae bacterium]